MAYHRTYCFDSYTTYVLCQGFFVFVISWNFRELCRDLKKYLNVTHRKTICRNEVRVFFGNLMELFCHRLKQISECDARYDASLLPSSIRRDRMRTLFRYFLPYVKSQTQKKSYLSEAHHRTCQNSIVVKCQWLELICGVFEYSTYSKYWA